MTTLTIGQTMSVRRLRAFGWVLAMVALAWCAGVLALAWTSPEGGGSYQPGVIVTPQPRPAGF